VWTEVFDGVSQGIGSYLITSDPGQAGANDSGQITIYYDVTSGDPVLGSADLGAGSYYGPSTDFSVTAYAQTASATVPEPNSVGLFLSGAAALCAAVGLLHRRPLR
jgi:hypothetical protein